MKILRLVSIFVIVTFLLTACNPANPWGDIFPGLRIDDTKVRPLETATCDNNGVIELTPLAADGTDADVRANIDGQTEFLATITKLESGVWHRYIAQNFKSQTLSVSSRGSDNQVIGPTLTVICP